MLSEIKQKEVEMQQHLEEGRAKLKQLKAAKDVAVAVAHMKTYDNFEGFESHDDELNEKIHSTCYRRESEAGLNPEAPSFHPHQATPDVTGM